MGLMRLPGEYAGYEWYRNDGTIIPTESPFTDMPEPLTENDKPQPTAGPTRSTGRQNGASRSSTPGKKATGPKTAVDGTEGRSDTPKKQRSVQEKPRARRQTASKTSGPSGNRTRDTRAAKGKSETA